MAPKEGSIESVDDFCRLCAAEAKNEVVIYSSEGTLLCLEDKIKQCLRINVSKDDILPKRVCCPCRARLEDFYHFAEQANQVQHVLETMMKMKKFCNSSAKQDVDCNLDEEIDLKDELGVGSIVVTEVSDVNDPSASSDSCITGPTANLEVYKDGKESNKHSDPRNRIVHQTISLSRNGVLALHNSDDEILISNQEDVIEKDSYKHGNYVCDDSSLVDTEEDELVEGCEYEFEKGDIKSGSENVSIVSQISYEVVQNTSDTSRSSQQLLIEGEDDEKDECMTDLSEQNEWKTHWGIKCDQCEEVFPFRSLFDEHYQTSYDKQPVYSCSYCNKTMEKYSTFRSHCYRHVTEGRYRCQYCTKGFSLKSMHDAHILAKHTAEKPYICEECGKGFVTRSGLNTHLKRHQTSEKNEYPCPDCGKILHTSNGLKAHQNVHKLGRRFMCDICGKTFNQKVNMQQHVKHHTGERPFTCEKCGKRFAEKSHLNRHYSSHSEKRPFQCNVCLKMYKTKRCLTVHSMVHAEARPYVCKYCSKGFISGTKLKQHYNIHTGERPYACNYCERTFTNYSNWLKHTRRRHKPDPQKPVNSSQESQKLPGRKQEEQPCQQVVHASTINSVIQEDPVIAHSDISKTFSQLDGQFGGVNPCSSTSSPPSSSAGMLHQYPQQPHSEVQSLSVQHIENPISVTVQSTQQMLQNQFSLNQVYTDHIIVTNETEPDSMLPL